MQRKASLAELRDQVQRTIPDIRYAVTDELAEFAASLMCERHRDGEFCDADCAEVARDILALSYLYNREAGPGRDCLACLVSKSDVCGFHEGWDQAVLSGIAEEFMAPRRRNRIVAASRGWIAAFRETWWPDQVLTAFLFVVGAVTLGLPLLLGWSVVRTANCAGGAIICWVLATVNITPVMRARKRGRHRQ